MNEVNREFAQRLAAACDQHPDVPPAHKGRQKWVADTLEVSPEAVRKWFRGIARPKPAMMSRMAKALDVDEGWLALGAAPTKTPREREATERRGAGAIYYVAGAIEMAGGKVAFPDPADPEMANVDIIAILSGKAYNIHVALGERLAAGHFLAAVPTEHRRLTVVGVLPARDSVARLVHMPADLIDKHGEYRGGYLDLEIVTEDGDAFTRDDRWPVIHDFRGFRERLQEIA